MPAARQAPSHRGGVRSRLRRLQERAHILIREKKNTGQVRNSLKFPPATSIPYHGRKTTKNGTKLLEHMKWKYGGKRLVAPSSHLTRGVSNIVMVLGLGKLDEKSMIKDGVTLLSYMPQFFFETIHNHQF